MRDAPLDTDSSIVPPGDSAEASGPWKPSASSRVRTCLPAGVTFQPAAVTGTRAWAAAPG